MLDQLVEALRQHPTSLGFEPVWGEFPAMGEKIPLVGAARFEGFS